MVDWILTEEQQFPTDNEQVENYKRNGNNEFLAVIKQKLKRSEQLYTVPVSLWIDTNKLNTWYWTIAGTDEIVVPIKWAMMPKPMEDNATG